MAPYDSNFGPPSVESCGPGRRILRDSGRPVRDKRETSVVSSVKSSGPGHSKHTARQSETSAGQVEDKSKTVQLRASMADWETLGGTGIIMRPTAPTAYLDTSAGSCGPNHLLHTGKQWEK